MSSSPWTTQSLGFTGDGRPGSVSWGHGRLDVFYVEPIQSTLQHQWFSDKGESGSDPLGGLLPTSGEPSAVSWGHGRLDIFGLARDSGALCHWWYGPGSDGWQGPEGGFGGSGIGNPSAASWGKGRLDVFAPSAYGSPQFPVKTLMHLSYTDPAS